MDTENDRPKYLTAEALLDRLEGVTTLGQEACRQMLTRVLRRVPCPDVDAVLAGTVFALTGASHTYYLSAATLEGRTVVLLGEGLLGKSEDEQAALILPLAARVVLKSRHPLERPAGLHAPSELYDESGAPRRALLREEVRHRRSAMADLAIDVHFAAREADELVRSWLAGWEESNREPAVPSGGPR